MDFGQIMFLYVSPAIAVLICVLNLTAIILLSKKCCNKRGTRQQRRPVPIIFLMNLAVSDLLVGCTVIIVKILNFLFVKEILLYATLAKGIYKVMLFIFLRISLLCSVLNLMALTIDRFLAIRNPMTYSLQVTKRQAIGVSLVTWLLSSAFVAGHYYISFYTNVRAWHYELVIFPAAVIPSSVVFTICYVCILRMVVAQGRKLKRMTGETNSRLQAHLLKREFKVAMLTGTVVLIFMVCWLPIAITGLIFVSGIYVKPLIVNPIFSLAFINSVLNPLVYFGFKEASEKNLRKICVALSACRCRRQIVMPTNQRRRISTALFSLSSVAGMSNNNNQNFSNAASNEGIELNAYNRT